MNFEQMIAMTALEYRLYRFFERIKELIEYGDKESIQELIEYGKSNISCDILDNIKDEVKKLDEELEGGKK